MRKSSARFLFVLLLLALSAAAFIPAAHADTLQKISVGGRPDGPAVDTATGDVYVVNDGAPGKPSNQVFVVSGTSLVATLALNSTRGEYKSSPLTNLRAGTYDSGDGYVYFPDEAGVGTPLAVVSGTEEVGNPDVGYPAAQATYDPSNGYVYIPNGEITAHLCTVDCPLPGGGATNNLGLGIGYCTGGDANGCQPYDASKPAGENDPREVTVEYGQISVVSGLTSVANITIGWDSSDPYNPNVPGFNESQDPTVTPAFDSNNNLVYVADTKLDVVYAISGTSVVGTIPVGSLSVTPVVDPTDGYVYVANSQSDSISVIDYTTVVATIPLSGAIGGLVYDPGDGYLYADGANNIWVISGNSVTATLNFGDVGGAAYDSDNGYFYFSVPLNGTVDAIDGTAVVVTDKVGGTPTNIAFDPVNGYLYAADEENGVIDVIIPASGIVVGTGCGSSSTSSSAVRSSSTTSSTTTTTSCCTTQSQTQSRSSTTSTTSSCTGVAVEVSTGNETGSNSSSLSTSSNGGSASVTAVDTGTGSATTGNTPPPTGLDGIPTLDLEVAGGVAAIAAVGGAIFYFTQGGGSGGSEEGGCEAPPDCVSSGPTCGPASPTGSVRLPTQQVTCTLATAAGPSVGENPTEGTAVRCCSLPQQCWARASEPLQCGEAHAARAPACVPSGSFVQVGSSATTPCVAPGESLTGDASTAPGSSASCSPMGHAQRTYCTPSCKDVAQVRMCQGGTGHATRCPTSESGCFATAQGPAVSCGSPASRATRCTVTSGCFATAKGPPVCSTSATSRASRQSCIPGCKTVAQVKCYACGPLGNATRTPCTPKGNVKVVKQNTACSSNQGQCSSTAEDTPACG